MAHFEELKQIAKDTAETIADKSAELYKMAEEKTKLLAKIAKLSADITLEKGAVRKLYRELGQLYYEQYKNAPEPGFAQICQEITMSLEVISEKQKEIDALRNGAYCEPSGSGGNDGEPPEDQGNVEIIVENLEDSAPGVTPDSLRSPQDTDTLEAPEGDVGSGQTPPFRL